MSNNENLPNTSPSSPEEVIKANFSNTEGYQKYQVNDELARGGMGVVYNIFDKELQRHLVMKILQLKEDLSQKDKLKEAEKFIEEARITAKLEHPNVVPVHDMGLLADGNVYFTMKRVEGQELSLIIKNLAQKKEEYLKKYTQHNVLTIFRKVCDAIAFAHSRNIIHRDIKPHNIMVGNYGEVLLMDWGLGKYLHEKETLETLSPEKVQQFHSDLNKTIEGTVLGTPLYMSPEQARGATKEIDKLSDIYLLGATLYHMLAFSPPHLGRNIKEVLMSAGYGRFAPPDKRNPAQQIPQELCRIIMKAMALKKEDRYQKVEELSADIDLLMSGHIASTPITFRKGEFLIREGEVGREAFCILKGKAEIYRKMGEKNILLATIGEGSVVGEMGLISATKRSADVVTCEETEVLVIDEKTLKGVLKRMPPWMEKVVSTLSSRLATANENVHPLMVADPVFHVLNQLGTLSTLTTVREKANRVENIEIDFSAMVKEISTALSLATPRVYSVLGNLLETELCEWIEGGEKFRFKNFVMFCHVLEFVRGVFEIDREVDWIGKLPPLDQEKKMLLCQIAAKLSKEVRDFLLNIPMYAKHIEAEE